MRCWQCGTINEPVSDRCSGCGAELHTPASPVRGKEDREATLVTEARLLPETIIHGRFRFIKSLGRGGMGDVMLAEEQRKRRRVAIKSVSREFLNQDKNAAERFRREAYSALQLDHPHICRIYEIVEEKGRQYIIMEHVDGVTLDQMLKFKSLSNEKILKLAIQIAGGITAAHDRGIIHRDLKPKNIMIDRRERVKILDFGLAQPSRKPVKNLENEKTEATAETSDADIAFGTVNYLSPEQARGLDLDERSDIFSFGIIMAEMIEGRHPFADKENLVTIYNILHQEVRFSPQVPEKLQQLVGRMLRKEPHLRYPSFLEILRDLKALRRSLKSRRVKKSGN